jgi:hypothetical protein
MRKTTTNLIVMLVSMFASVTPVLGQEDAKLSQEPPTRSPLEEQRLRDLLNEGGDEVAERKNRTEKFNALRKILDRIESSKQRTPETPSSAATQVVAAKPILATPTDQAPTGRRLADEGNGDKSEDLVRELLNRIKRLEDQVSELRIKLDKLSSKQ